MSGYGFDEPTRQIITGALAAAVASAAASRDDPIDPIRHIAFYLLPNDDVQAVFHVHELLRDNRTLRDELQLWRDGVLDISGPHHAVDDEETCMQHRRQRAR